MDIELKLEIDRLKAVQEIKNCMAHYETVHIQPGEIWKTPECFALWRPDVSCEVSDWGCFFGPEAVEKFWKAQKADELRGGIFFHSLCTPAIQVAGNCKTAKATWHTVGFETMPPFDFEEVKEYSCFWCFGKYGIDFIRNPDTGEWKIWHFKYFRIIRNRYETNWYDDAKNTLIGVPSKDEDFEVTGRKPSVFHRPYRGDIVQHPFPIDPKPYYDYDGDFRWIFGGEEYEKKYDVSYPLYEKFYNANYPERV